MQTNISLSCVVIVIIMGMEREYMEDEMNEIYVVLFGFSIFCIYYLLVLSDFIIMGQRWQRYRDVNRQAQKLALITSGFALPSLTPDGLEDSYPSRLLGKRPSTFYNTN